MIHVVALITAKPRQRATVLEAFAANRPAVLAEQGCIEYGATIDTEGMGPIQTPVGPDTFVVIEKWESVDALKAHALAPHRDLLLFRHRGKPYRFPFSGCAGRHASCIRAQRAGGAVAGVVDSLRVRDGRV